MLSMCICVCLLRTISNLDAKNQDNGTASNLAEHSRKKMKLSRT